MNVNFASIQPAYPHAAPVQTLSTTGLGSSEKVGGTEDRGSVDKRQDSNAAADDSRTREDERENTVNNPQATREALKNPNSAESQQLRELKKRDREVRTHELAHLSAAGQHARGGPTFKYERGPDGQRYVVGGHVNIDTSSVAGDPEATLRKAEVVRRAALAPANPSPQDRSVAANASSMAAEARREIMLFHLQEATTQKDGEQGLQTNRPDRSDPQHAGHHDRIESKISGTGAVATLSTTFNLLA